MENKIKDIPDVGNIYDKVLVNDLYLNLQDSINFITHKSNLIIKYFIQIGIVIAGIHEKKLYEERGFDNIYLFAKSVFGFSKNQTYNFIAVANKFSRDGNILPFYANFSFSQLVEMINLPAAETEKITPGTTIKEIREIKKQLKNNNELVHPDQHHAAEEIIEVEFKEVKAPDLLVSNYKNLYFGALGRYDELEKKYNELDKDYGVLQAKLHNLNLELEDKKRFNDITYDHDKVFQLMKDRIKYLRSINRFGLAKEIEDLIMFIKNELD